jgi:hypothetical protein
MTSIVNATAAMTDRKAAIAMMHAANVIRSLPFPYREPRDVTLRRGEGKPNITVIYHGEMTRQLTREGEHRKTPAEPGNERLTALTTLPGSLPVWLRAYGRAPHTA